MEGQWVTAIHSLARVVAIGIQWTLRNERNWRSPITFHRSERNAKRRQRCFSIVLAKKQSKKAAWYTRRSLARLFVFLLANINYSLSLSLSLSLLPLLPPYTCVSRFVSSFHYRILLSKTAFQSALPWWKNTIVVCLKCWLRKEQPHFDDRMRCSKATYTTH